MMIGRAVPATLGLLGLLAACTSGGGGAPGSDAPLPGGSSGGETTIDGGGADTGPGPGSGHAFPVTLTPLTEPRTSTANISLFFSVVDANGFGVADFTKADFAAPLEDGVAVDPNESDFQVMALAGQSVRIPTVLLLDLSGSVVAAGALETLKKTATSIVDAMLPEQTLAIVSFAAQSKVRSPLTADKTALKAAIAAITDADGPSTNLYGAMIDGFKMWTDSFTGAAGSGQITAGLQIVITDGADTAAAAKLTDVITARANRRVVAIGVGADINVTDMKAMGNAGFLNPNSYQDLEADLTNLTGRLQTLGKSIYSANYCSPKQTGPHTLEFTVLGNAAAAGAECKWATFSAGQSCTGTGPSNTEFCSQDGVNHYCCPADLPYVCMGLNGVGGCFATAEQAKKSCDSACIHCGGTGQASNLAEGGAAIRVAFTAQGYQSQQCPKYRGPSCKALDTCCATDHWFHLRPAPRGDAGPIVA